VLVCSLSVAKFFNIENKSLLRSGQRSSKIEVSLLFECSKKRLMVNIMKSTKFKNLLTSTALVAALAAPSAALANIITHEYIFDLNYKGQDFYTSETIIGIGTFSFFYNGILENDLTVSNDVTLTADNSSSVNFNANFQFEDENKIPSDLKSYLDGNNLMNNWLNFELSNLSGVGLAMDSNNEITFKSQTIDIIESESSFDRALYQLDSGLFQVEYAAEDINNNLVGITIEGISNPVGLDQTQLVAPIYSMTLRESESTGGETGGETGGNTSTDVPEPSTWALMLVGAGLILRRKFA
jgi:hypothetical protein